MDNFTNILAFAKNNPKAHLLLGNHDLSYALDPNICRNRIDKANYDDIRKLFIDNKGLFSLAYDCTINGKSFFISHAGITPSWYERHLDIFDKSFSETLCADYINQLYRDGLLNRILGDVGSYRRGPDNSGSMVWADFYEHEENQWNHRTDIIQIVGHSQRSEFPLRITQNHLVYDVDIRQCVFLDIYGNLCSLSTGDKFVFN